MKQKAQPMISIDGQHAVDQYGKALQQHDNLSLLHPFAQVIGHDWLGTTMLYIRGTKQDLQQDVAKTAWI